MKPGVHFCNIARGTLVDQDALRAADGDTIARASLDVCTPEPLPEGHWMYHHPKVLLTPHTSWMGPGVRDDDRDVPPQLPRLAGGEPLDGLVDIDAGY